MKAVVFDAQLKVLAHFVTVENLASADADVLLAAERTFGALGGDRNLLQLFFGGGQQIRSFARALFRQQGIEASNQTFARKGWMTDLDQVRLIEQGHLQLTIFGQSLDLAGAQSGNPLDTVRSGQVLADACAGDHAAVADQNHILETESLTEFVDLG